MKAADADIDQAAEVCAAARMVNAGQSCIAGKRFIVRPGCAKPSSRRSQQGCRPTRWVILVIPIPSWARCKA